MFNTERSKRLKYQLELKKAQEGFIGSSILVALGVVMVIGIHTIIGYGDSIRVSKTEYACSRSLTECYTAESTYNTEYICNDPVHCWAETK